jgi:uncharacterized protein YutE (UPF0331/DUF86 family)
MNTKKQQDYVKSIFEDLDDLDDTLHWLKRSYRICREIGIKEIYAEEEFDAFETLTGRFSRSSDMLIQKIFRGIDKIEFEKEGTLLDVLNRSEKKGLIKSVDEIREIREMRNDISHEYAPDDLQELFKGVLEYTEVIFEIVDRVKQYCEKFRSAEC